MSTFMFYLITCADRVSGMLFTIFALTFIVAVILGVQFFALNLSDDSNEKEKSEKRLKKPFIIVAMCAVFLLMIYVFTPSTKSAMAIYVVPKIVNNEKVQQIPDQFLDLCKAKFNQWINESVGVKDETER